MYSLSERLLSNPQGVKSVQRGIGKLSVNVLEKNIGTTKAVPKLNVAINKVDPNKCVVLVNGSPLDENLMRRMYASSADQVDTNAYVYSLTEDNLEIRDSNNTYISSYSNYEIKDGYLNLTSTSSVSWQIIEFY